MAGEQRDREGKKGRPGAGASGIGDQRGPDIHNTIDILMLDRTPGGRQFSTRLNSSERAIGHHLKYLSLS